jgi:hypothetical protein
VSKKFAAFTAKDAAIEYTTAMAKRVIKKGEATRKVLIFIPSSTMSLRSWYCLPPLEVS